MADERPAGPPRVLFSLHRPDLDGGAERAVVELVLALADSGAAAPTVAVPSEGEVARTLTRQGLPWRVVPTPWWCPRPEAFASPVPLGGAGKRVRKLAGIARRLPAWRRVLRELRPDVVVTASATIPTAALAARWSRIPHVWWLQEFATRDHGLVYVVGEPAGQRVIGRLSTVVVANSRAVAGHYSPPVRRSKVVVIHYGIDPPTTVPNQLTPGELRVLLLGYRARSKGTDVAVRALGELVHEPVAYRLRLVGRGDPAFEADLRALVARLGLESRVEFVDFTADPAGQLAWSNVVLMCSPCEAFGRVTVEALKSGRPVLGASGGATPDLVAHGVDGFLFPVGDHRALAGLLRRLGEDPALLRALARRAREGTSGRFTMADEVEGFAAVFDRARSAR